MLLPHRLRRELPPSLQQTVKLAAVGGPSIAGELAANRHTCVVVTGNDAALIDKLARMLRTPYYHVWPSTDMVGVEIGLILGLVTALLQTIVLGMVLASRHDDDRSAAGRER